MLVCGCGGIKKTFFYQIFLLLIFFSICVLHFLIAHQQLTTQHLQKIFPNHKNLICYSVPIVPSACILCYHAMLCLSRTGRLSATAACSIPQWLVLVACLSQYSIGASTNCEPSTMNVPNTSHIIGILSYYYTIQICTMDVFKAWY